MLRCPAAAGAPSDLRFVPAAAAGALADMARPHGPARGAFVQAHPAIATCVSTLYRQNCHARARAPGGAIWRRRSDA